jgi:hypothetical protein
MRESVDSDSVCEGSNPSPAATVKSLRRNDLTVFVAFEAGDFCPFRALFLPFFYHGALYPILRLIFYAVV